MQWTCMYTHNVYVTDRHTCLSHQFWLYWLSILFPLLLAQYYSELYSHPSLSIVCQPGVSECNLIQNKDLYTGNEGRDLLRISSWMNVSTQSSDTFLDKGTVSRMPRKGPHEDGRLVESCLLNHGLPPAELFAHDRVCCCLSTEGCWESRGSLTAAFLCLP